MRILAFDTSTSWCSVAAGDARGWRTLDECVGHAHSERLLKMIDAVLAAVGWSRAGIEGIAFGSGPGSFTGVRVATGVAQGLAWGLDCPVLGISTLAAVAQAAHHALGLTHVLVCNDARMQEVYTAAYANEHGSWREVAPAAVMPPDAVATPAPSGRFAGAGSGFAAYPQLAQRLALTSVHPDVLPEAAAIGALALSHFEAGLGGPPEQALPLYVRHRVALTTAEREAGMRL